MEKILPRRISRLAYGLWGLGLMLLKYAVEYFLVVYNGGVPYGPLTFVLPIHSYRLEAIGGSASWVGGFILIWSLPFVFLAVWFTIGRALDARVSPWMSLWILCPTINLLFMVSMCFLPRREGPVGSIVNWRESETEKEKSDAVLWMTTILLGLLLTTGILVVSIYMLGDYGASVFFSSPVFLGTVCGYAQTVYGRSPGGWKAVGVGVAAVLVGAGSLIVVGIEGVVCIVMALPIMVPAAAVGGVIGYLIAQANKSEPSWMTLMLVLPSAAGAEHFITQPVEYQVTSVVEIDATREEVWDTVVAFPEITAPPDLLSRMGVAYPVRARIEGRGVGAVRYCEFSTGPFVEPITVWDQPSHLAFDVVDQPCPLTELSPWEDIHPPHLDGFMQSHHGEFRLIELPEGRTRLEGRTWYSVDMYPQLYWRMWTDSIIHSIHHRVLNHIAEVVESDR